MNIFKYSLIVLLWISSVVAAEPVRFVSDPLIIKNESAETFEIYHAERDSSLQSVLDEITASLFGTELGRALCTTVFNNPPEKAKLSELERRTLLSFHLGLRDENILRSVASVCSPSLSVSHRFVFPKAGLGDKKMTVSPGDGRRLFALVFSDSNNVSFDSWTDPFANRTIFIAPTALKKDFAQLKVFLLQAMAHETFVYFNSKSSLWSKEATLIDTLNANSALWMDHPDEGTAVANPHIASALAALAAFRVEKEFVDEIDSERKTVTVTSYPKGVSEFLQDKCHGTCLHDLVSALAGVSVDMSLPLLALSSDYTKFKLDQLRAKAASEAEKMLFEETLIYAPQEYLYSGFRNFSLFDLVLGKSPSAGSKRSEPLVNRVFKQSFMKFDLEALKSEDGTQLVEFMTKPLMSGYNIRYSAAPRPRFRGY